MNDFHAWLFCDVSGRTPLLPDSPGLASPHSHPQMLDGLGCGESEREREVVEL